MENGGPRTSAREIDSAKRTWRSSAQEPIERQVYLLLQHVSGELVHELSTLLKKEGITPEQYQVLRKAGTERAFTGKYWDNHEDGIYRCAGCGAELFGSDTKFESGSGWPSFTEPKVAEAVEVKRDVSHGMIRTEVVCKRCGGHLGHVFDDGPRDKGGLRYCMNSCAMDFQPTASE